MKRSAARESDAAHGTEAPRAGVAKLYAIQWAPRNTSLSQLWDPLSTNAVHRRRAPRPIHRLSEGRTLLPHRGSR